MRVIRTILIAFFLAQCFSLGFTARQRRQSFFRDWFSSLMTSEVCFHAEGIGCFDNKSPYNFAQNKLPDAPSSMGIEYLLYTRKNKVDPQTLLATPTSIKASNFDGTKKTKFIIHGFRDHGRKHWVNKMKNALLDKGDMNVIAVDWKEGAKHMDYAKVSANTRVVGAMLAKFLKTLVSSSKVTYAQMHLIGQSLGSHVAGFAGSRINKLGRITGLDPAGPNFENKNRKVKLDSSDATFVDVIHTDSDPLSKLGFGIKEAIGHVDFYPNGGNSQPGCNKDLGDHLLSILTGKGLRDVKNDVICSHMRVTDLFTESINSKCRFTAFRCTDTSAFKSGTCTQTCGPSCPVMGYDVPSNVVKGNYYLRTNGAAPFCVSTI